MKTLKTTVILICALLLCTSCNFDRYAGERPTDYGNALWVCDAYHIWFAVDLDREDPYDPEGGLKVGDTSYFCKFYFIHQTNQLHISIYPIEYAEIPDASRDRNKMLGEIEGECSFSSKSFVFTVESMRGEIFEKTVKQMTFLRVEQK